MKIKMVDRSVRESRETKSSQIKSAQERKSRTYSDILRENAQKKNAPKEKEEPEYLKKEKSIRYIVKDGFFSSIKSGFTDSYIMPFAIALNASTGMLSILASVPQLVASFFQLFAQKQTHCLDCIHAIIDVASINIHTILCERCNMACSVVCHVRGYFRDIPGSYI